MSQPEVPAIRVGSSLQIQWPLEDASVGTFAARILKRKPSFTREGGVVHKFLVEFEDGDRRWSRLADATRFSVINRGAAMPEASRSRIDALSPFDTDPSVAVQAILDRTERPGITLVLFYQ
jgi:hypothetical protein